MASKNEWMTNFYGSGWFMLDSIKEESSCEGIYELRVDSKNTDEFLLAQANGFTLVETQLEFRTSVRPNPSWANGNCRLANPSDFEQIIDLTRICFWENEKFSNRFKNSQFFELDAAENYYRASLDRCFNDPTAIVCVAVLDDVISGYFMMAREEVLLYRGIMTAVLPHARGMNLHVQMQNIATLRWLKSLMLLIKRKFKIFKS
jgi:hypothetical protein